MEKVKKPIYKKWWFWVIIVVVVFAIAAGGSGSDKKDSKKNSVAGTEQTDNKDAKTKDSDAKDAEPLAKALIEGGLPCAEVTFRTAAAEESIRIMAEKFPELVVGAGTVLTPEQADRAMNAGAKFIVSPGLNPKVVKHCLDKGYPIVPGTSNPSDVETAIELGLDVVKFFPAEAAGGLNMIKSMAAPYTNMKFMPTGGINAGNLKSYFDFNNIA